MAEVTKEDIKAFIDLEKKIQTRIVELSRKFVGIPIYRIEECVNFKIPVCFDTIVNSDDFVTNEHKNEDIYLGVAYEEDGRYMNFNKNVLCLTDAEAEKIYQHDQEFRRQEAEEAKKKEEARKAELAKKVEETEYKQYLALKKKYEGK
jgi:hypothetical protein